MALEPVLGHRAAMERLWSAEAKNHLHHALLLEGPQGVGKRLIANRLAMAANCTGTEDWKERPCGTCPTCRQIMAGTHPDVIVVEPDLTKAARAIPVDAVREVIRKAQYHRYGARHRFILVDPAEAMQESAANALLKTLEEPPPGTGFLLITHNATALLPTIRSRCQRIRLGAVPLDDIVRWLVAKGASHPEAAARLSLGCPGRALAVSESGLDERQQIRNGLLEVLRAPLGGVNDFAKDLASGSRQAWAPRVDALLEVLEDLVRDTAIIASSSSVPLLNEDLRSLLEKWANRLWPMGLVRCAEAIQACRDDLEVYVSGRTALDALLLTVQRELKRV